MQDIQKVVRLCQDGQLEAFSSLFNHFQNRVYDLACTILRDENAAEDVVQDTFLAVFQKIGSFRGESAFETWLTAIAVNQCRMRQRKLKVRQFLSLDRLSSLRLFRISAVDDTVTDIVHSRQRRQALWDMVDEFDERLRLPMILRYRYGLPCSEIAIILERRTSTIYQQLNEGRRLLEKMQQQEGINPILAESSS
jgi:RNA polymerase sigma-70 factor (ECF subfamily)